MNTRRIRTTETRKPHGWLDLLQTSGPFLTLPVLTRVFGDRIPAVSTELRARIRVAAESMMRTDGDTRTVFIDTMLDDAFGWGPYRTDALPDALCAFVDEHSQQVRPDLAFTAPSGTATAGDDEEGDGGEPVIEHRLFAMVTSWDTHPLTRTTIGTWTASPAERLAVLLRARDVPIGLVTDGRWWAIVWAPRGGAMGVAVWDASLFSEEPDSLAALIALLGRARFLGVADTDRLPELLTESATRQDEITDQLGLQVREAVELLITTIDRLDHEAGGTLLAGVDDDELYSGAVTVMMRIIFVLFAEERRLLPSDHAVYDAGYSIGDLEAELREHASLYGEQTLEHRTGAWHRLLATARALHAGVAHEDLRLPAYGGTLFDPDIHPWLEGRTSDQPLGASRPPAVDDRTVLRMLRAVQYVELGTGKNRESRRLTFRALGVEQIGYVYEGLLELEVRTANDVVVHLERPRTGQKQDQWPRTKPSVEVPVDELATWLTANTVAEQVKKRTRWTPKKVATKLAEPVDDAELRKSLGAHSDLLETIRPVAPALMRTEQGLPVITLPGRRYLAPSIRRASTGTHYTPPQLAERIVAGALEPLIYRPGPLETADRDSWVLRPSDEIRDLRIADIAMGSGAFLVAACRYLADRLLEARSAEGEEQALRESTRIARGTADAEVPPVLLAARREIAERCLYGVDINDLAVEMAKLSLWLLTMDPQRPFGFLDDRLVQGDSLLGLVSAEQLDSLHIDPVAGRRIHETGFDFSDTWHTTLRSVADTRRKITAHGVSSIRDVEFKQHLLAQAQLSTKSLGIVADYLTGIGLTSAASKSNKNIDTAFVAASIEIGNRLDAGIDDLYAQAGELLQRGRPENIAERKPLHWPVAFPEILSDNSDPGFDAIVGNPPFIGGQDISGSLGGDYLAWLQRYDGGGVKGSADISTRFILRAQRLLNSKGQIGLICTKTVTQGASLRVGIEQAVRRGMTIRKALSSHKWPTASASLEIVEFWGSSSSVGAEGERTLDNQPVSLIGPDLMAVGRSGGVKYKLSENSGLAFIGSYLLGEGFEVSAAEAEDLIARNIRNRDVLQPYVTGKNINKFPEHYAGRWVINFRDWPLEKAKGYPDPLALVEARVKPVRDEVSVKSRRVNWWRYASVASSLYSAIEKHDEVVVMAQSSSTLQPAVLKNGFVFDQTCVVFSRSDPAFFAFLASDIHFSWVSRFALTVSKDFRYTPSDVFSNLPIPTMGAAAEGLGHELISVRSRVMKSRALGLTDLYNFINEPECRDREVLELRSIHSKINREIFDCYGWRDLDVKMSHYPVFSGTRWTLDPVLRNEVVERLIEENNRRYFMEVD